MALAKKKNDRIHAGKICDCLRCDFLPDCYMAPTVIRERRAHPALTNPLVCARWRRGSPRIYMRDTAG